MNIIIEFFQSFNPVTQALIAGIFVWVLAAFGAATVFITQKPSQKLLDFVLGVAGGIMISASFWSLLIPSIEMSQDNVIAPWFPTAAGFLMGGIFLRLIDMILPHLHIGFPIEEIEGVKTSWQRSTLFILAIVLHNIPEGLALGVAFGAVVAGFPTATLPAAIALAIGMGIHNFPEGSIVSISLRREGMSRLKSFWYGQLSTIVEPMASVMGAMAVLSAKSILPYALAFAAGAMIFVVVEEIIPESQRYGNTDLATGGAMIGLLTMLVLGVTFG